MTQEMQLPENLREHLSRMMENPQHYQHDETELAADRQQNEIVQSVTFWAAWILSASTTAVFGAEFNSGLFLEILQWLPFSQGVTDFLAAGSGAIASLVTLDIGYKLWNYISLHRAKTIWQYRVAYWTAGISFGLSILYTVIALALLGYPQYFTPDVLEAMEFAGAASFTGMVAVHVIAAKMFVDLSPEVKRKRTFTKIESQYQSEELDFMEKVLTGALKQTSKNKEEYQPLLTNVFDNEWTNSLVSRMMITNPEIFRHMLDQLPEQLPAPQEDTSSPTAERQSTDEENSTLPAHSREPKPETTPAPTGPTTNGSGPDNPFGPHPDRPA